MSDNEQPTQPKKPIRREIIVMTSLAALLGILLPLWPVEENTAISHIGGDGLATYLPLAMDMILPAIGFLLVLQCRKIDLSVWATTGLGSLVAAYLIAKGQPPVASCIVAIFIGGVVGAINAALSVWMRIPTIISTLVIALAIIGFCSNWAPKRYYNVPEKTFDSWRLSSIDMGKNHSPTTSDNDAESSVRPLATTRILLSLGFYAIVIFLTIIRGEYIRHHPNRPQHPRAKLTIALIASGMLCAGGGVIWLVDHGQTFAPTQVIGDLRIPTAALLAGGLLVVGRERTMLTMILLPAAMLACTVWMVFVASPKWHLGELSLWILIGQAAILQLNAWRYSLQQTDEGRSLWLIATLAAIAGLLILASTAWVSPYSNPLRVAMQFAGPGISIIALALAIWARTISKRHAISPTQPAPAEAEQKTEK